MYLINTCPILPNCFTEVKLEEDLLTSAQSQVTKTTSRPSDHLTICNYKMFGLTIAVGILSVTTTSLTVAVIVVPIYIIHI